MELHDPGDLARVVDVAFQALLEADDMGHGRPRPLSLAGSVGRSRLDPGSGSSAMTIRTVAAMGDIQRQYARTLHDLDCTGYGSGHEPPTVVDHELEAHEPLETDGVIAWPRIVAALRERGLILAEIDSNERDENPYIRGYNRGWEDAAADPDADPSCRVCGCTDDNACPGGCSWVEPDLCSDCAPAISPEASEG